MPDWVVSGAGSTEYNGVYVDTGTYNSERYYLYTEEGSDYYIANEGDEFGVIWCIEDALASAEPGYIGGVGVTLAAGMDFTAVFGSEPVPEIAEFGGGVVYDIDVISYSDIDLKGTLTIVYYGNVTIVNDGIYAADILIQTTNTALSYSSDSLLFDTTDVAHSAQIILQVQNTNVTYFATIILVYDTHYYTDGYISKTNNDITYDAAIAIQDTFNIVYYANAILRMTVNVIYYADIDLQKTQNRSYSAGIDLLDTYDISYAADIDPRKTQNIIYSAALHIRDDTTIMHYSDIIIQFDKTGWLYDRYLVVNPAKVGVN